MLKLVTSELDERKAKAFSVLMCPPLNFRVMTTACMYYWAGYYWAGLILYLDFNSFGTFYSIP